MAIMKVSGEITVLVDGVDIEQLLIERASEANGFTKTIHAMMAAISKDETRTFQKELDKCDHVLEYVDTVSGADDTYLVKFKIRKRLLDKGSDNVVTLRP